MRDRLYVPENLSEALGIAGCAIAEIGEMLYREYGRRVLVIIDEYDVPLHKAMAAEVPYYQKMLGAISVLCGNTFKKDSLPWLYKGIVSGCLKIAHQSVFTDASSFTTYGMSDEPYTGFFGFTEDETRKLLADAGLADKEEKVREWYDGYRFGRQHVYCPWSLVSYCAKALNDKNAGPQAFWVNTSGNDLVTLFARNSMEAHDAGSIDRLQRLMDGEPVEMSLQEFTAYPDMQRSMDFDDFMTMMLHTGYVTLTDDSPLTGCIRVRIPSKEVYECFADKVSELYSRRNPKWFKQAEGLVNCLLENRSAEAQRIINSMLRQFISVRNSGHGSGHPAATALCSEYWGLPAP